MDNEKKTVKTTEVKFTEIRRQSEEKKEGETKTPRKCGRRFVVKPDEPVYTLPVMPPDYDEKTRVKPVEK